jgi:hypothetical protein
VLILAKVELPLFYISGKYCIWRMYSIYTRVVVIVIWKEYIGVAPYNLLFDIGADGMDTIALSGGSNNNNNDGGYDPGRNTTTKILRSWNR